MTQEYDSVLSIIRRAAETGAKELDLRGRDLHSVPSEIGELTSLEMLWLDRNKLQSLPDSLQNLQQLNILSLRHNEFTSFPEQLTRLSGMRQLYLDHNRFRQVPKGVWQLKDLWGLGLSGIKKPKLEGLERYPNLNTLYLQECELHGLPNEVLPLERLRALYLEGNELSSLPYLFMNLQALEDVYLGRNAFRSIPESLLRMSRLRYLNLMQNEIGVLPDRISNWTRLRSLVVANNPLGHLPEQIGSLKNLRALYAYSADLLDLPAHLVFATKLEVLEVGSNLLTTLPRGLQALRKLNRLNLFNNGFTDIPYDVCDMTQLKELVIDSNELRTIRPEIGQLRQLEVLDVRNNQLDHLPAEIGRLSNLRVLRLANNELDELPRQIGQLRQLTDLDLAHNRNLHRFPETLTNLEQLRTCTVNHIGVHVPLDIRDDLPRLRQFLIDQQRTRRAPATERSEPVTDHFQINFLPDVDELKRIEQRASEPAVLRISRFELDGVVDIFPYQKLQVVYMFEHSLLPVPPWFVAHLFLARTRRFRTGKTWVGGGVLAYESEDPDTAQHVARLDSSLEHNALALTVIGPFPQNFFTLLLAGLDRIVDGLSQAQVAHRLIYCPDPKGENCRHRFDFDAILSSLRTREDDLVIPCPNCHAEINFHEALVGLHPRTASIVKRTQDNFAELIGEVEPEDAPAIEVYYHLLSLRQRFFLQLFQRAQFARNSHFPRLFVLRATSLQNQPLTADNIFDYPIEVQLCCELPGRAHLVNSRMTIPNPRQVLVQWRPYLLALKTVLPTLYHTADNDWSLRDAIDQTMQIISLISNDTLVEGSLLEDAAMNHAVKQLHNFFVVHRRDWVGGVTKVRTPEGLYLWVDSDHAKQFDL